ncbi:MAG: AcrR family transcriptional regulator [Myxococcota bacterium]|jgi:AcrR family transcriptional regulator
MTSTLPDADRPPSTAERILAGAAVVVADHGLRDSTVRHILAAASLSRRTFYLHYPSIEGVMCDLYIHRMGALIDAVVAAMERTSGPQERILAAVEALVDFQLDAGVLLIHLQTEAVRPGSMLSPVREQTLDRLVALLSVGRSVPPLRLRGLLMGVEGLLLYHCRDPAAAPIEMVRKEARLLVLNGIEEAAA